ncbi:hypothetical protein trycra_118 [Candidatus Hodgkinia cicadicola]|uniref:Uncharacterized protein n=1 Tax=Candidatus Hodgkinia cicadicola TaxID=573658 RepID=A0ABX4MGC4_9HYPH|nr:hypothetical protein trycra_118 [Candidatus Hodgkinia cicadicola]
MKYCSNNINTLNYSLGWFKTKRYNSIVLSSICLESLNTVVERVELSIFNNYVVLRAILNKDKTKDVELKWYIRSNNEDIELSAFKLCINNAIHETFIDNCEFMRIKLNGLLCLSMSNRSETVVNFYVKDILECLKGKGTINKTMLTNQSNLQWSLKYNLEHKVKEYINQVNVVDDLVEQYDKMKQRLLIEVNLPWLVAKQWKTNIRW